MRIHQFNGKESGLMIIGSATELRRLGEQLQALTTDKPDFSNANWPTQILSIDIDRSVDFSLSFNIETRARNVPVSNMPSSEKGKTIFFVLTIIGLISVVRFLLSYIR